MPHLSARVREQVPIALQDDLNSSLTAARDTSIMSMSPEPEEECLPASCTAAARASRPQGSSREAARAHGTLATKPARRPQREEPLRPRRDGAQPERRRRLPELPDALRRRRRGRRRREHLCGNQPVRRVHRQCFTKSFLGDDAAVPAPSGGEEPAPSRYRAGTASMAWRSTRRFRTNAP